MNSIANYSLMMREDAREMFGLLADQGVESIPKGPVAKGRLTRPWGEHTARFGNAPVGKRFLPGGLLPDTSPTGKGTSRGSVGVGSPEHPDNSHPVSGVIDPIEHAVGATSRAVAVVERRAELLADAVRVFEQRADDEFVGSEGDGLGQLLS
jgi:hypothetical protein